MARLGMVRRTDARLLPWVVWWRGQIVYFAATLEEAERVLREYEEGVRK